LSFQAAPLWQARPKKLYRDILLFMIVGAAGFRVSRHFKQDRRLGFPAAVFLLCVSLGAVGNSVAQPLRGLSIGGLLEREEVALLSP